MSRKNLVLFSLIISFAVTTTVNGKSIEKNVYNSLKDTLVIKTKKVKGSGHFPSSMYGIELLKPNEKNYFPIRYSKEITDVRIGLELIDFKPYWYQNLKKSKSEYLKTFLSTYFPSKIDTAQLISIKDNSISILCGRLSGKEIFIVDQNNNKDFTDDSIRPYKTIDMNSTSNLIKCEFNIYNGVKMLKDSGWVNIGINQSHVLSFSVSQHMEASFTLDGEKYKIGFVNGAPFYRFCFENPLFAVLSQSGIRKDSLLKSEMFELNEYIRLGKQYYRFADISNEGKYIKFIKEKDIRNKIGTQINFLAPDFVGHTLKNDSIYLAKYKGKYLILANLASHHSPTMSYEYFRELSNTYGNKAEIFGIDYSAESLEKNLTKYNLQGKFLIAEGNNSILKNYRKDYSSTICFLINPEGRIVEKFDISLWKQTLQKYF